MRKKRKNYPKNIEELEDIFYGGNFNRRKKYMDSMYTDVISPYFEKEILRFINRDLSCREEKENRVVKTFDYVFDDERVLLEITSINALVTISENFDSSIDLSEKIDEKILHIEEKSKSGYEDFVIGGAIFIDFILLTFTRAMETERLCDSMSETNFKISQIDFLLFLPQPASINRISSYQKYPPVIFIKDAIIEELVQKIFPNIRIVII